MPVSFPEQSHVVTGGAWMARTRSVTRSAAPTALSATRTFPALNSAIHPMTRTSRLGLRPLVSLGSTRRNSIRVWSEAELFGIQYRVHCKDGDCEWDGVREASIRRRSVGVRGYLLRLLAV